MAAAATEDVTVDEAKEVLQLADDGCPHVEPPMMAEEIAADPALFVKRNIERPTYCLFVPFSPPVLRAMVGKEFRVSIDPFRHGTKGGSLIETQCKEDYDKLCSRFTPPQQEYDDGPEKEVGTATDTG